MDEPLFDASNDPNVRSRRETPADGSAPTRPFLGIRFECCKTYGRIYRNAQKTAYTGKCPSCFAKVTVPIGNEGSSTRFFTAR
jgi:hypothetical protein